MSPKIGLSAVIMGLAACGGPTAPARVTYANTIKACVQAHCADCHGEKSPSMEEFDRNKEAFKARDTGPRYDTYENLMVVVNGSDTGALMRRLDDGKNTKDGKPGNMYEHLGKNAEERAAGLALFKAWVGGWTLKRKADITAEERAAILAPRD